MTSAVYIRKLFLLVPPDSRPLLSMAPAIGASGQRTVPAAAARIRNSVTPRRAAGLSLSSRGAPCDTPVQAAQPCSDREGVTRRAWGPARLLSPRFCFPRRPTPGGGLPASEGCWRRRLPACMERHRAEKMIASTGQEIYTRKSASACGSQGGGGGGGEEGGCDGDRPPWKPSRLRKCLLVHS